MDQRGGLWSGAGLLGPFARLFTAQSWPAPQRPGARYTATSAASTETPNMALYQDFYYTATQAVAIAAPTLTSDMVGQRGMIQCNQDGTGGRTYTFATSGVYAAAGGITSITTSTGANAQDNVYYHITSTARVFLSAAKTIS